MLNNTAKKRVSQDGLFFALFYTSNKQFVVGKKDEKS